MVVTSVLGQSEFSVDPTFLSFGATGGTTPVTISNSTDWEAKVDKDAWVHLTPGTEEESNQLTVEVDPNNTGTNREATITITDKSSEGLDPKTIRVVQQAPELNIVEPATTTLTSSEQDVKFSVYSNVNWKVTIVPVEGYGSDWLRIKTIENEEEKLSNELSGSNNFEITLLAEQNSTSTERKAKVKIINVDYQTQEGEFIQQKEFTLTQVKGEQLYLTINPSSIESNGIIFGNAGGDMSFDVISNSKWNYSVSGEDGKTVISKNETTGYYTDKNGKDFLKIDSVSSANGVKNVKITALNYTGNEDRTAYINITWDNNGYKKSIKVTQKGNKPYLMLTRDDMLFGVVGGIESIDVNTNVSFTLSDVSYDGEQEGWLTVSRDGNKITVSAGRNDSNDKRVAVFYVNGEGVAPAKVTVTQYANAPFLTLTRYDIPLGVVGGSESFDVNTNVSFTLSDITYEGSQKDWLTVSPDDKKITVSAGVNPENDKRVAVFYVNGGEDVAPAKVTVTQYGNAPFLTLTRYDIPLGVAGGSESFDVNTNVSFTLSDITYEGSQKDWLTVSPDDKKITVSAGMNESNDKRVAVFYVKGEEGVTPAKVTVTQGGNAPFLMLNTTTLSVDENGNATFDIASNVAWTVKSDADWLTVLDPSDGKGKGKAKVTIHADVNAYSERAANIIITWNNGNEDVISTIAVTQLGAQSEMNVSPKTATLYKDGGEFSIKVSTKIQSWTATSKGKWISLDGNNKIEGKGDKDIVAKIAPNDGGQRTADVEISWKNEEGKDTTTTISIVQGGIEEFVFNPNSIKFDFCGSSEIVEVTGLNNIDWKPEIVFNNPNDKWVDIEKIDTVSSDVKTITKRLTVKAGVNTNDKNEAVIQIVYYDGYGNKNTVSIPIEQKAWQKAPNLEIADNNDYNVKKDEKNSAVFLIEPEAGLKATIKVNLKNLPDNFKRDEWALAWSIEGGNFEKKTDSLSVGYNVALSKPQKPYEGSVKLYYKNYQDDCSEELVFYIYPSPKTPKELKAKGGDKNTSRIMIATMDNDVSDDYRFVFGYDSKFIEDNQYQYKHRYCQYDSEGFNSDKKWVYTVWVYDDGKRVRSKNAMYFDGEPKKTSALPFPNNLTRNAETTGVTSLDNGIITLTGGHLSAQVANPSPANITVISMSGTVVKRLQFAPRCDFDEELDLSGLPSGMYIIRCNIGSERVEQKVVIK
jgi:hypothetical protein